MEGESQLRIDATGIVLAGGKSRRMGMDKADLVLDGQTLLARTVHVLRGLVEQVLVVGCSQPLEHGERTRYIPDDEPGAGPLGALYSGLRIARTPFAIVVATDMPFLSTEFLRHMLALASGFDAVVPVVDGQIHPLHAIYSRRAEPAAKGLLATGDRTLGRVLCGMNTRWIERDEIEAAGLDLRSFLNVNTPDDWEYVVKLASRPSVDRRVEQPGGRPSGAN